MIDQGTECHPLPILPEVRHIFNASALLCRKKKKWRQPEHCRGNSGAWIADHLSIGHVHDVHVRLTACMPAVIGGRQDSRHSRQQICSSKTRTTVRKPQGKMNKSRLRNKKTCISRTGEDKKTNFELHTKSSNQHQIKWTKSNQKNKPELGPQEEMKRPMTCRKSKR